MMSWSSCSVSVRWFSLSLSHFAILKYTMFITCSVQGSRGGGEWRVWVVVVAQQVAVAREFVPRRIITVIHTVLRIAPTPPP